MPKTNSGSAIYLSGDNDDVVVFSPADYDSFILTQREVLDACRAHQNSVTATIEAAEAFKTMIEDLRIWCSQHDVARCVISPRMDDILVMIIAKDEDEGGRLHDAMSALDLDLFRKNRFRLFWMLLRASEASGLSAFAEPRFARTVFSADAERASRSSG